MTILTFSAVLGLASFGAGLIGAITGLGGGFVIIPLLVIAFGVDIRYAIGASLLSVIATSSGAAAAYVREGYSNIRLGMFLEIATTMGALSGAMLGAHIPTHGLAVVFGLVLLCSAYLSGHGTRENAAVAAPDRLAVALRLDSIYPTPEGPRMYRVRRIPTGFGLMYAAGVLSGLLGIGSGALKVVSMDQVMRLPFKVSTTTSNFMIGVTAAASAGVYLHRGYIDPGLGMPVVLGVLAGSMLGARVLNDAKTSWLRAIFLWVIIVIAFEMLYNGVTGTV
jgi:uncharacterized protein